MVLDDQNPHRPTATPPPFPASKLVRVVRWVQAVDVASAERFYPSPTEPRPAFSVLVFTNVTPEIYPWAISFTRIRKSLRCFAATPERRPGWPHHPEGQAAFMVQMQFQRLDLPCFWSR